MIKIANNLTVLLQTRHKQSFTTPTEEQQMLASLDPVAFNSNNSYQWGNMLHGGLLGGGIGALAGLPFGGVGALPGAGIGGLAGIIAGGVIPELRATKAKIEITPEEREIIKATRDSKNRRIRGSGLKGLLAGGGAGALVGLPLGGVGALPGAGIGALAGKTLGNLLAGYTKDNVSDAFNKNNPVYHQLLAKLQKTQANKSSEMRANDVVNMGTFGGGVADYLAAPQPGLGTWGARRAARSSALGESVGIDPGMLLQRPLLSRTLGVLSGAGLGAGLGAGVGGIAGELHDGDAGDGGVLGALIGAGVGGLSGSLLTSYLQRKKMKEINKAVDAAETLNPIQEQGLGIGVHGGVYNLGRVQAEQIINSGGGKNELLQRLMDSAKSQGVAGPLLSPLLPYAIGETLHGINHDVEARRLRAEGKEKRQNKDSNP